MSLIHSIFQAIGEPQLNQRALQNPHRQWESWSIGHKWRSEIMRAKVWETIDGRLRDDLDLHASSHPVRRCSSATSTAGAADCLMST